MKSSFTEFSVVIFHWVFTKNSYENAKISLGELNENFTFHRLNIFFHWIFMDKISSSEKYGNDYQGVYFLPKNMDKINTADFYYKG